MGNTEQYTISDALEELERAWAIPAPLGASDLDPVARFLTIVTALRDKVCPRLVKLNQLLGTQEAALVAGLMDVLGPAVTKQPLIVGSIFKAIVAYGIDRFCRDPAGLLMPPTDT